MNDYEYVTSVYVFQDIFCSKIILQKLSPPNRNRVSDPVISQPSLFSVPAKQRGPKGGGLAASGGVL